MAGVGRSGYSSSSSRTRRASGAWASAASGVRQPRSQRRSSNTRASSWVETARIHVEVGSCRPGSGIRLGVEKLRAMREAVGPDFEIAIDAHGQLTPPMALDFAERVPEYRPLLLEEPTQPEDLDSLAWLSSRTRVPLATGERLFTKWGFADLCARHLVSYVQPDVVHCGGILELK